jgi:hypothetical protein
MVRSLMVSVTPLALMDLITPIAKSLIRLIFLVHAAYGCGICLHHNSSLEYSSSYFQYTNDFDWCAVYRWLLYHILPCS